jgi:hypothetical protein
MSRAAILRGSCRAATTLFFSLLCSSLEFFLVFFAKSSIGARQVGTIVTFVSIPLGMTDAF